MLNSIEHEFFPAHKCLNANNCWHFNIYEQENSILEHENSFITSGPEVRTNNPSRESLYFDEGVRTYSDSKGPPCLFALTPMMH